ncbi:MAG: MotA/TolQ/ExbB proton channel family protein [Chitinispirillaceae bacterium]|nr:MotA/TolQ/ExbB proton channel family protein [Chitinispirillaceae bacterium]
MRTLLVYALVLAVAGGSYAARDKKKDVLDMELQSLNETLQGVRDSLEAEIAARYSFKQHTVEQRETDKEEYERLREKQETALTSLSKIKEEALVKEQNLGEVNKNAKEKLEEWTYVKNGFDEMMQKEADGLVEAFPVELEKRRSALENVRRLYREKADPLYGWDSFLQYRIASMAAGRTISLSQEKLLPDDGVPRNFSVARFGNVFAYCMDTGQQVYMIRQTGRLGAERFAVEPVLSPELSEFIHAALPQWTQDNMVSGPVMTEVMQNEQAKLLVAGKENSFFQEMQSQIKAGGWVMIPLLLLPVWALILVLRKTVQFWVRSRKNAGQMKAALALIEKQNFAKALSYAKSNKGLMARILEATLESRQRRDLAEVAIRKLIMQEIPVLNRNLNTIAVIAGAAPLLGLLGTISGMITLFAAVTYYGTGDPKFLAGGISEALITAKTGLAIAIPTLFVHDFLRNYKEHLLSDIEAMALRVLDKIVPER